MRKINKYIGGLFLTAVVMSGCQDDFDAPGLKVPVATLTKNTSILEVKQKYWSNETNYIDTIGLNDAGEHIVIAGRVISSDASGNIYKNLVIQDESAALTLSINANSLYNTYRIGQEVIIDVTDMYIGKYSGLQQMGFPDYAAGYGWQATFMPMEFFELHSELNGLPEPAKIDTVEVKAIADLPTTPEGLQKWQSQLVRINNVHFEGGGELNYTDEKEVSANRTLYDQNGSSITVRNSGYARFYADKLPAGNFDIVGILSYFGTSGWQLLLRTTDDCMNVGTPTLPAGTETNPYTVAEVVAMEMAEDAEMGWVTGYIVGAVAPEVETVTSSSDIEWTAPTTLANTLVIATSATATSLDSCLVISLPQDSKLRELANLKDNAGNIGKQIWLSGKFEKYMGTWGITGNRGTASEFKIDGVEIPDGSIAKGDGSEASPYNVEQILSGIEATGVWATGYIVGWVEGMTYSEGVKFSVPATSATNVIIAGTPTETDPEKCVPVQLPSGDLRSAINLMDNPTNIGKKLSYKGSLTKYFGVRGLKEGTAYKLDGEGSSTPEVPSDPVTTLDENFDSGTSFTTIGWKTVEVLGNKPWWIRNYNSNNYATVSGYQGTAPFDEWLISPAINISEASNKILNFETQANGYGATTSSFEVYVLTSDDPTTATKTKLDAVICDTPNGSYSSWTSSGNIDLSGFSGIIYIGFRYQATQDANYATYCLDNVKLVSDGSSTPEDPKDPEEPVTPVVGNAADFNTMNDGTPKSSPYTTYTSAAGWVVTNSVLLGGDADAATAANPRFGFIGGADVIAPTLNGKTSAPGTLTSPTISGGIKTLSFNYGFAFSDTQFSITINIKQNGAVVKSETVEVTGVEKQKKYDYTLDVNVSGDFVIEIVNNCLSASSSNKDRLSIWNLTWTN